MEIKEAYCSYEVSKLLKEKGFSEKCTACYREETTPARLELISGRINYCNPRFEKFKMKPPINAPTHQMAMAWLKEEYNIFIQPSLSYTEDGSKAKYYVYVLYADNGHSVFQYGKGIQYVNPLTQEDGNGPRLFDKTEEAIESALKYTLKNLI